MANHNRAPPVPSQPATANIQSIEDIIESLQLWIHGERSSDDRSTNLYACIPGIDQNDPESDKIKILDPGPIRAQLLVMLNKCTGSIKWVQYTKRHFAEPRGASGKWAVRTLDKVQGTVLKKNVCAS